ncbi:MAG TPA: hypothetical protein VM123_03175 [archaeon]|nr:hypothetical protein [archaeon]
MKKTTLLILFLSLAFVDNIQAKKIGDFNGDGDINILDAISFIRIIVNQVPDSIVGQEYIVLNGEGLKIGTFDGYERIRCYSDGNLAVDIYATSALGTVRLISKALETYETTYEWRHTGYFSRPYGSACLIIPKDSILPNIITWQVGDAAPVWDNTNKKFKVYVSGDTTYTFSPDTEINAPNLSGLVCRNDFDSLVARVNAISALLGADVNKLKADSGMNP